MQGTCAQCRSVYDIPAEDLKFYDQIGIPAPKQCPPCREQRRMAWSNEGVLYPLKCKRCAKNVISEFSPGNPREIYCFDCWWGDGWSAITYGRDVDLSRSIRQQIHELELAVPHPCVNTDLSNENSEYTHHAGHEKNCYMLFHASFAEDCYYGYGIKKAKNCVDNHYCHESELCYECTDVQGCYGLAWSQDCSNCNNCLFLADCRGCKDCLLCVGLRNKQYCVLNEQLTKTEYEKRRKDLKTGSFALIEQLKGTFAAFRAKQPRRATHTDMTEDCLGDHLYRARKAFACFDCSDIEFSKYCAQLQLGTKSCYDIYQFGIEIELCCDCCQTGYKLYDCQFCFDVIESCSELQYCLYCHTTHSCFGCVGLKRGKYCILNKQYTKEAYEALLPAVIERMKAEGEYGEFLPAAMSPHGYNETIAQMWYPRTKQQVLANGWNWEDNLPFTTGQETLKVLSDTADKTPDGIVKEILVCGTCRRNYKIIPQELTFYRNQGYPLPRECFQCRRLRRHAVRNPRSFRQVTCGKCAQPAMTTCRADGGTVYCEKCYRETAA